MALLGLGSEVLIASGDRVQALGGRMQSQSLQHVLM